jgi:xanthosine phosphorylase
VTEAAAVAREALGSRPAPRLAVVLGSGLGGFADTVEDAVAVSYADLPGFPVSTGPGHAGRLVLGTLAGTPVAVFQGRSHLYEGVAPQKLAIGVRTAKALGAQSVCSRTPPARCGPTCCRAGSWRSPTTSTSRAPTRSSAPTTTRSAPGSSASPPCTTRTARAAARGGAGRRRRARRRRVPRVSGPSFETPAEIRAFRTLGADAVGMSTVLEAIAARHAGLRVAGVSVITNLAEGLSPEPLSHDQTLAAARAAAGDMERVLRRFVQDA